MQEMIDSVVFDIIIIKLFHNTGAGQRQRERRERERVLVQTNPLTNGVVWLGSFICASLMSCQLVNISMLKLFPNIKGEERGVNFHLTSAKLERQQAMIRQGHCFFTFCVSPPFLESSKNSLGLLFKKRKEDCHKLPFVFLAFFTYPDVYPCSLFQLEEIRMCCFPVKQRWHKPSRLSTVATTSVPFQSWSLSAMAL